MANTVRLQHHFKICLSLKKKYSGKHFKSDNLSMQAGALFNIKLIY